MQQSAITKEENGLLYDFVDEFYYAIHLREDIYQTIMAKDEAYEKFDTILAQINANAMEALQITCNKVFGADAIIVD